MKFRLLLAAWHKIILYTTYADILSPYNCILSFYKSSLETNTKNEHQIELTKLN